MKSILNIDGFSIKKTLNIKGNLIDLSNPIIMGILNLTPDSFYDGDLFNDKKKALLKVEKMIDEGADIIDVGGCSTRPGAEIVSEEEEWNRIEDIIQSIRKSFPNIIISIDTFRSTIANKYFDIGADVVISNKSLKYSVGATCTTISISSGCISKSVNISSSGPMPGSAVGNLDILSNFTLRI